MPLPTLHQCCPGPMIALMKNSQIVNPSTELLPHVLNLCPCLSCVPCGNQVWGEGLQIEKPTISYGQQELLFGRQENQEAKSYVSVYSSTRNLESPAFRWVSGTKQSPGTVSGASCADSVLNCLSSLNQRYFLEVDDMPASLSWKAIASLLYHMPASS